MRLGDTPVLIPNTMVKTLAADGTMLETVWESRWLPECKKNHLKRCWDTLDLPVIQDLEKVPGFEWLINSQSVAKKFANVPWKPNIEINLKYQISNV